VDELGRFAGTVRPTGIRPKFTDHLKDVGIDLPANVFGAPDIDAITRRPS
jgi:pilus assembly protein CpaF